MTLLSDDRSPLAVVIVPVTPFVQNCTLLIDRGRGVAVAVDPGGEIDRILAALAEEKARLTAIWLTHGHIDHVAGAPDLAKAVGGVPILGPQAADAYWLQGLAQQAQMFGFPPARAFTPEAWLNDGEHVAVGDFIFQVLHVPGHTPGHLAFYQPEMALVLVGDLLFVGSVGRTDFPGGDAAALERSIRTKLFPLGDEVRFIPGHGPTGTLGEERRTNPFVGGYG
jgi:glyoxylase-like metal-dependent hydrolase (beta-lactamase superfamily II)